RVGFQSRMSSAERLENIPSSRTSTTKNARVPPKTTVKASMHEILPDLGFFDDVPGRDEDQWGIEPPRQPDWIGPPDNMTGGTVVLDLVLANTGDAAVAMRGAWA